MHEIEFSYLASVKLTNDSGVYVWYVYDMQIRERKTKVLNTWPGMLEESSNPGNVYLSEGGRMAIVRVSNFPGVSILKGGQCSLKFLGTVCGQEKISNAGIMLGKFRISSYTLRRTAAAFNTNNLPCRKSWRSPIRNRTESNCNEIKWE